jgi:hypothetical protein
MLQQDSKGNLSRNRVDRLRRKRHLGQARIQGSATRMVSRSLPALGQASRESRPATSKVLFKYRDYSLRQISFSCFDPVPYFVMPGKHVPALRKVESIGHCEEPGLGSGDEAISARQDCHALRARNKMSK